MKSQRKSWLKVSEQSYQRSDGLWYVWHGGIWVGPFDRDTGGKI